MNILELEEALAASTLARVEAERERDDVRTRYTEALWLARKDASLANTARVEAERERDRVIAKRCAYPETGKACGTCTLCRLRNAESALAIITDALKKAELDGAEARRMWDEAEKDYADMRRFQREYIAADQARQRMREALEGLLGWQSLAPADVIAAARAALGAEPDPATPDEGWPVPWPYCAICAGSHRPGACAPLTPPTPKGEP